MARVTVEDCTKVIKNRFQLAVLAASRSRDIIDGALITVERDNDKNPIIALREIAENKLNIKALERRIIYGKQAIKNNEDDSSEGHDAEIHEELAGYHNFEEALEENIDEDMIIEEFNDISFDDLHED